MMSKKTTWTFIFLFLTLYTTTTCSWFYIHSSVKQSQNPSAIIWRWFNLWGQNFWASAVANRYLENGSSYAVWLATWYMTMLRKTILLIFINTYLHMSTANFSPSKKVKYRQTIAFYLFCSPKDSWNQNTLKHNWSNTNQTCMSCALFKVSAMASWWELLSL